MPTKDHEPLEEKDDKPPAGYKPAADLPEPQADPTPDNASELVGPDRAHEEPPPGPSELVGPEAAHDEPDDGDGTGGPAKAATSKAKP